jgi:hypothetical protein
LSKIKGTTKKLMYVAVSDWKAQGAKPTEKKKEVVVAEAAKPQPEVHKKHGSKHGKGKLGDGDHCGKQPSKRSASFKVKSSAGRGE